MLRFEACPPAPHEEQHGQGEQGPARLRQLGREGLYSVGTTVALVGPFFRRTGPCNDQKSRVLCIIVYVRTVLFQARPKDLKI